MSRFLSRPKSRPAPELEKLAATVMRLALEHPGAERGLSPRGKTYRIEAEAGRDGDTVTAVLRDCPAQEDLRGRSR